MSCQADLRQEENNMCGYVQFATPELKSRLWVILVTNPY